MAVAFSRLLMFGVGGSKRRSRKPAAKLRGSEAVSFICQGLGFIGFYLVRQTWEKRRRGGNARLREKGRSARGRGAHGEQKEEPWPGGKKVFMPSRGPFPVANGRPGRIEINPSTLIGKRA